LKVSANSFMQPILARSNQHPNSASNRLTEH